MKNVIVTGPTGEIGLALVNELIEHDIYVTAIVNPGSKRNNRICNDERLTKIECSLSEIRKIPGILKSEYDTFYHLGWAFSRAHNDVDKQYENIGYTLAAVDVAKALGCSTFIGAGSQAEFGTIDGKISPCTSTNPNMAYGVAKVCAGDLSRLKCKELNIRHIWPRIISVYGPGDAESTMIISVIRKLLNGEEPKLTAGEQMWDFLYSKDCARALRLLGESKSEGGTYCIGYGKMRPLKEFMAIIKDSINPDLILGLGKIPYRKNQVMKLDVDISALVDDTGFFPKYSFEEGIRETIEWCKNNPVILKPEEV